ncbi:MAG: MFS transporter [Alphaproteobacteria bacterium]|nr:MFS transporter [Alphaproteobacteria bacterium]
MVQSEQHTLDDHTALGGFDKKTINAAIAAGCAISFLSYGFSAGFGVFLQPMSADLGWSRQIFSLSVALQMFFWGLGQPLAGIIADRHGAAPVIAVGAVLSAIGFLLRGTVLTPEVFIFSGALVGLGMGGASFATINVALGKVMPAAKRSLVIGLGTAFASLGVFIAAPASLLMINVIGWENAILAIGGVYLLILTFLYPIARVSRPSTIAGQPGALQQAVRNAFADRSYVCLFIGFFVCGFHVAFIQTHLPAYASDSGLSATVGAWALSLIGLFNIAGSLLSGWLGQFFSKKWLLSGIYLSRAIVIAIFVLSPVTASSIYIFSAIMGLLWLSTVAPTTGLIAQTHGLTYLGTLWGLVFLSHQVGSFLGAWLGGLIYDIYQDYSVVWWMAVVLVVAAALVHVPIRETSAARAPA